MHVARESPRAPLMEAFASIQGEGRYVGEPQVFLRLWGCPLRCVWCDTPGSWAQPEQARARVAAPEGARDADPWISPFQAACLIGEVEPREPRTVSVTGGEPLMWPAFVAGLRSFLGGRRVHLETAGGHPEALEQVRDHVDHISLDLKLPRDMELPVDGLAASEPAPTDADDWQRVRRRCLELVTGRDAAAKVVVCGERSRVDYEPLFEDLSRLAPDCPLYLQPVSPRGSVVAPTPEFLTVLLEDARDLELDVRVVPQVHRALRIP